MDNILLKIMWILSRILYFVKYLISDWESEWGR